MPQQHRPRRLATLSLCLLLSACGGGGGGNSGPSLADQPRTPHWVVIYADPDGLGHDELFTTLDDGSMQPLKLSAPTEPMAVSNVYPSPDGGYVAFLGQRDSDDDGDFDNDDEPYHLYRVPVDGSEAAALISGPLPAHAGIREVSWSPAGDRLIFRADIDTDTIDELYLVDLASTTPVKINGNTAGIVEMGPVFWSPDGRYAAQLVLEPNSGSITDRRALNVYDTQLGAPNSTRVSGALLPGATFANNAFSGAHIGSTVTWTTDGQRLAYQVRDYDADTDSLYETTPAGAYQALNIPLAAGESLDFLFAWSSDGRFLAYRIHTSGVGYNALEVYDTVTDSARRVAQAPAGGSMSRAYWRPGSQQLAFSMSGSASSPYYWYLAEATETTVQTVLDSEFAGYLQQATWSSDGRYLAYAFQTVDYEWSLYTIDADAGAAGKVSHASTGGLQYPRFEWLAGDEHLLYAFGDGVYVTAPDEADPVRVSGRLDTLVTTYGLAQQHKAYAAGDASPDSQALAFVANDDDEEHVVYRVLRDGSGRVELLREPARDDGYPRVTFGRADTE